MRLTQKMRLFQRRSEKREVRDDITAAWLRLDHPAAFFSNLPSWLTGIRSHDLGCCSQMLLILGWEEAAFRACSLDKILWICTLTFVGV